MDMLETLRKTRVVIGLLAVIAFATIAANHVGALFWDPEGTGILGSFEPVLFVLACLFLAATVVSIPFLRQDPKSRQK